MVSNYKYLPCDRFEKWWNDRIPNFSHMCRNLNSSNIADIVEKSRSVEVATNKDSGNIIPDVNEDLVQFFHDWLSNRQVYDFSDELFDQLSIDSDNHIPVNILNKLPYDCFFINHHWETDIINDPTEIFDTIPQNFVSQKESFDGIFVHKTDNEFSLQFLYSEGQANGNGGITYKFDIELDKFGSVDEMLHHYIHNYSNTVPQIVVDPNLPDLTRLAIIQQNIDMKEKYLNQSSITNEQVKKDVEKAIACVLYIISKNADTEVIYKPSVRSKKKTKGKNTRSTVHAVGYRIGKPLGQTSNHYTSTSTGTGKSPKSHMRRGHYHSYWIGPKNNPTDIVIHWVAPTFVHGKDSDINTIHKAK